MVNLDTLPEVPLNSILGLVGINDILSLRKVSTGLCDFIDAERPEFNLQSIKIELVEEDKMRLSVDSENESFKITYANTDDGTEIECEHTYDGQDNEITREFTKRHNVVSLLIRDLKIFLHFQTTSWLDEFHVKPDDDIRFNYSEKDVKEMLRPVYLKLHDMLKFTDVLNTREAYLEFSAESHIAGVLTNCNPENFTTVNLRKFTDGDEEFGPLKMSRLVKMPFWKNLKDVTLHEFCFKDGLPHLKNVDSFQVTVDECTQADMLMLKDMMFENPTFESGWLTVYEGNDSFLHPDKPNKPDQLKVFKLRIVHEGKTQKVKIPHAETGRTLHITLTEVNEHGCCNLSLRFKMK